MGKRSKRKGYVGEAEFAKLTGGKRQILSGALGGEHSGDVVLPNGWKVEVKRRKNGLKTLYKWFEEGDIKPDCVAFRADRKDWIVSMKLERFLELMEGKENG